MHREAIALKARFGPDLQTEPDSISVVIMNYNYGRFLADAINSTLNQQTPFNQIIVVDDGSNDESREVIESFGDRIDVMFLENGGQLGAALAGLDNVRSRWVYFLDADDYLEPDAVRTIVANVTGDPVKLQFQLRCVDNAGPLDSVIPAYPPDYTSADMQHDNQVLGFYICPPTSGNVYLVNALRRLPLKFLNRREFIDGSTTLSMPYLGEVRSVPRVVANYRIHGANDSSQHHPTPAMFERDISRLHQRWQEVEQLAPGSVAPGNATLIELEARCLIQPLNGKRLKLALALNYVRKLNECSMSRQLRLMLSTWMLTLVAVPPFVGKKLIYARRSPVNRSYLLKKILRLVLGVRQSERA